MPMVNGKEDTRRTTWIPHLIAIGGLGLTKGGPRAIEKGKESFFLTPQRYQYH